MILDIVTTLGGLVVPPLFNFLKSKFTKAGQGDEEAVVGELAANKPEALPQYVEAMSKLYEAKKSFFNRDVIGEVSRWVSNLRAAIRPIGVILCFLYLILVVFLVITGNPLTAANTTIITGTRLFAEGVVSSWFGSRISLQQ